MTISALEFLPDDIASSESHQVAAAHHEAENSESRVPVHLLLARPAQIQLKSSHIAKSYGVSCEEVGIPRPGTRRCMAQAYGFNSHVRFYRAGHCACHPTAADSLSNRREIH